MAVITPSTDVILLKVPLEISDINQLTFANATAQYNYFFNLPKITFDSFTYQRKDSSIRVPALVDDLYQYNYVMYRNTAYSNKWFYAYITSLDWVSDQVTSIGIKTDVWQTWQFDLTYKKVFVEREHVNDDTVGLHTIPENLELGEYQINDTHHYTMISKDGEVPTGKEKWYVCFCVTEPPEPNNPIPIVSGIGHEIGAVFTALQFFAVSIANGYDDANDIIEWYRTTHQTIDTAIINMYMIPYSCVDFNNSQTWTNSSVTPARTITVYAIKPSASFALDDGVAYTEVQYLSGLYTPRNKKLLCYPFCYLYLDNKCGESAIYHWEDGEDVNLGTEAEPYYEKGYTFKTAIVPSASMSAKMFPTTYKGKTETSPYYGLWNYGINFGKVPVCAWTNDYYTNWLTQNGVNVGSNLALGIASATLGVATGGLGLLAGGIALGKSIANTLSEIHKAETTPPQAQGNVNVGDSAFAYTFNNITAYQMTIKKEVATVIDSYFDMYGYQVNEVKIPNVTGRTNWNYVKTQGCYIKADIPQEDLQEIKSMFDKGITFWHNPSTFMDYSQSNAIVTP